MISFLPSIPKSNWTCVREWKKEISNDLFFISKGPIELLLEIGYSC